MHHLHGFGGFGGPMLGGFGMGEGLLGDLLAAGLLHRPAQYPRLRAVCDLLSAVCTVSSHGPLAPEAGPTAATGTPA